MIVLTWIEAVAFAMKSTSPSLAITCWNAATVSATAEPRSVFGIEALSGPAGIRPPKRTVSSRAF
jgi:hypothetical protein